MTSEEVAAGLLRRAALRAETMRRWLADGFAPDAFRAAQECVELSLKALLFRAGIDPPKWHDVGDVLLAHAARIPGLSAAEAAEFALRSAQLRRRREQAMYGDEDRSLPPEALISRDDARAAVEWAERVYETCRRLLGASRCG